MDMPSDRFISLAMRVVAYDGVLTKHMQHEQEQAKKASPAKALRTGQATETPISALDSGIIEMK